jgi:hypothetical protein
MRNSSWRQYSIQQSIQAHRTGWLGAWDALVSAITGKPRFTFTQPITISWWARHGANVVVNGVQVETNNELKQCQEYFNGHQAN